jgi:hypothetical protein
MGGLFSTVMRSDMSVIEELIREFRAALEKGQWRVGCVCLSAIECAATHFVDASITL